MIDKHVPVMLKDSIDYLSIKKNGVYVDCTFGSGGHSREILLNLEDSGKLISFDCDDSTSIWRSEFQDNRFFFINDNFSNLSSQLEKMKIEHVDGFLFDLGLSSMQLELPRGFSYRNESSPLDMRMDSRTDLTAEEIINNFSSQDLADIFFILGEERKSYKLANAIVRYREKNKIVSSEDLVKIITGVLGKRKNKQHPAKKIFQALRIKVNNELENLENALNSALKLLAPSGRIVVISYHSLEDRIVKNFFRNKINEDNSFVVLSKKPILPKDDEIYSNRKSRSAKMRIIERIKNN
ncbi:MAG: Ribosomal RNA small subunit methyltransferase H [Mycoplasmataceae bacterium]|nr:MAG: Ribosomal RNA small subunit methyltransferase H [Mycoplasmataceae bacterium]